MQYIAYLRDKAAAYRALSARCLEARRPPPAAECDELARVCERRRNRGDPQATAECEELARVCEDLAAEIEDYSPAG
jgi:hypothetical protein